MLSQQVANGPTCVGSYRYVYYGQTDDIPLHLRRLVILRDQHCQFPGGYFL